MAAGSYSVRLDKDQLALLLEKFEQLLDEARQTNQHLSIITGLEMEEGDIDV
jgi:hypothetical protein